jgi:hypothetical protein
LRGLGVALTVPAVVEEYRQISPGGDIGSQVSPADGLVGILVDKDDLINYQLLII